MDGIPLGYGKSARPFGLRATCRRLPPAATRRSEPQRRPAGAILDCGGKSDATPLSDDRAGKDAFHRVPHPVPFRRPNPELTPRRRGRGEAQTRQKDGERASLLKLLLCAPLRSLRLCVKTTMIPDRPKAPLSPGALPAQSKAASILVSSGQNHRLPSAKDFALVPSVQEKA